MNVEIRKLDKPEEYAQAKINSSIAFNFKIDTDSDEIRKPLPNADIYGAFEDDRMVSHIIAYHYQMMCHGKYVPLCGIGDVCTLVEFRNKGYVRKLFHTIFDAEREAGCIYSYLYPFSYQYYNKFGYGFGSSNVRAEIPVNKLGGYECNYDVTMYQSGDPYQPYQEVFEKFAKQYTGTIARNDRKWLDEYIPTKTHKSMFLFTENGVPKAFLGYRNFYNQGGDLHVERDIAWDSPEAFRNILGFLYKLRMHNDNLTILLPRSFPIETMLKEQRGSKFESYVTGQVRVIDVVSALKSYPWPEEKGILTIGVKDDYFADNNGSFCVRFGGGGVGSGVEKSDDVPDIELDIKALSPLLFGSYGFDDLLYFSPETVSINKNIPVLKKAFTRRPIFFTEPF